MIYSFYSQQHDAVFFYRQGKKEPIAKLKDFAGEYVIAEIFDSVNKEFRGDSAMEDAKKFVEKYFNNNPLPEEVGILTTFSRMAEKFLSLFNIPINARKGFCVQFYLFPSVEDAEAFLDLFLDYESQI